MQLCSGRSSEKIGPRRRRFFSLMILVSLAMLEPGQCVAQNWINNDIDDRTNRSFFRPLDDWPDPSEYRNAAGAPGSRYWQQQVDYQIQARLDTAEHRVYGSERITYHNNSPDILHYLWLQLDQNIRSVEHSRSLASKRALPETMSEHAREFIAQDGFDGGHKITRVQSVTPTGTANIDYIVSGTNMKVHLDSPVRPGEQVEIEVDWNFLVPGAAHRARGARELVSDGWMYQVAQWFPRLSVYDDVNGWQTDQFLGSGEFYLEFGNYTVDIEVPHDHIVEATGVLENPEEVLTNDQIDRLNEAYESEAPVFIITPEEAATAATRPSSDGTLVWRFRADNVRDFVWVSSRAYVWDAVGFRYSPSDDPIALHSFYPREAMPLWDKVSTKAIAQTLETYGRMAFEYPYPKAANVHGPVFGMEYPMVAFCGARPAADGFYSPTLERALISVTIHEIGHNWFPMVVASDERRWTWLDEGLNSFLQYYTEQDWKKGFPSRRGPAKNIVEYMLKPDQVPIMIHSDLIHKEFSNNGYAKPAAGLVMLREQIVSTKLFDEAFRQYAKNWAFKHPQPADFFRSIEEGTGEDLAWFWRGWFYTTHVNDQAISNVWSQPAEIPLGSSYAGQRYYRVQVDNEGGLVMPVHLEVHYRDGSVDRFNLPADVWRLDETTFVKGFNTSKEITKVLVDPDRVFADVNMENNSWELPSLEDGEGRGSN
jgi:hypothetical protein